MDYKAERRILQELGTSCMKLGQLALDNFHVTPAVGQENPAVTDSILYLMWLKDQVIQQTVELQTGVKACVETNTEAMSEDNLKEAIQVIEKELEDASVSFQHKTMALHRLQYTHALREVAQMNNEEGKLIMETIKHSLDLCSEIVTTQKHRSWTLKDSCTITSSSFSCLAALSSQPCMVYKCLVLALPTWIKLHLSILKGSSHFGECSA
uniref:centromere protein H isoform X2 n=1 Tax=Pristiophorus japonicus TaxID=55135 RepID=UPI00398EA535